MLEVKSTSHHRPIWPELLNWDKSLLLLPSNRQYLSCDACLEVAEPTVNIFNFYLQEFENSCRNVRSTGDLFGCRTAQTEPRCARRCIMRVSCCIAHVGGHCNVINLYTTVVGRRPTGQQPNTAEKTLVNTQQLKSCMNIQCRHALSRSINGWAHKIYA